MVAHFADEFSYRVEWEVEANSILDGLGNRNIPSLAGCPCVLAKMMDHEPVSDHPFELHSGQWEALENARAATSLQLIGPVRLLKRVLYESVLFSIGLVLH